MRRAKIAKLEAQKMTLQDLLNSREYQDLVAYYTDSGLDTYHAEKLAMESMIQAVK